MRKNCYTIITLYMCTINVHPIDSYALIICDVYGTKSLSLKRFNSFMSNIKLRFSYLIYFSYKMLNKFMVLSLNYYIRFRIMNGKYRKSHYQTEWQRSHYLFGCNFAFNLALNKIYIHFILFE